MADSPVTEGQILAGKYRVERVLGSGGMGVVVAAWHLELEQRVAVKFLHPLALERADTAERFRREARSAAKIRSEHVARVIDIGIMEGNVPYMVMEYLEGHDVSEEMAKVGMLPIEDAVDFVLQAIEALAEAHTAGIVHRDLKPANLFIATRADGSRIVKVLDFGISKSLLGGSLAELSLTRTSVLIGSPLYMSPEQMRSAKDVDTRTDIWSLGVILYEMLTGRPPYTGDSIPALCASLLSDVPASLQTWRRDIPLELEGVIMRCLTKDRDQRYGTVSELARALAPFGSVSSQLHVDRASRVMDGTDGGGQFVGAQTTGKHRAAEARLLASQRLTPQPGTVDSWGRTDAPNANRAEPRRSRTVLMLGLGLSAAGLLGILGFLALRGSSMPANAATGVAAAAQPIVSAPSPVPPRAPVAEARPAEPEVLPSAVAPSPSAPLVRPAESVAKPRPVVPPPVPISKPVPTPKGVTSSDLSDFGGRR